MLQIILALALLLLSGCASHRYTIQGESDTNEGLAVSIMHMVAEAEPVRLYYTELTRNGTEFLYDQRVEDAGGQVEAWFELKSRPGSKAVYAIPPDRPLRVKIDVKKGEVVIEKTKIGKKFHGPKH